MTRVDPWDAVVELSGGDVEAWPLHIAEARARMMAGALHAAIEEHADFASRAVEAKRAARVAYDTALLLSRTNNDGFSVAMHEAHARQQADQPLYESDLATQLERHHRKRVDGFQSILVVIQSCMKNSRALSGGQR